MTVAAVLYGGARAVGLTKLGQKVSLLERSIPLVEGNHELAEALQRDKEGGGVGLKAQTQRTVSAQFPLVVLHEK